MSGGTCQRGQHAHVCSARRCTGTNKRGPAEPHQQHNRGTSLTGRGPAAARGSSSSPPVCHQAYLESSPLRSPLQPPAQRHILKPEQVAAHAGGVRGSCGRRWGRMAGGQAGRHGWVAEGRPAAWRLARLRARAGVCLVVCGRAMERAHPMPPQPPGQQTARSRRRAPRAGTARWATPPCSQTCRGRKAWEALP